MTDPHPVEDHRAAGGDRNAPRRRTGQPWLLAGLGVLIVVVIACVLVWINWTQDSARTGPREVTSDEMRLAAPAAGTSATTHPDAPTTAAGDPAPPKAGTDPNVNDGPGGTPPQS